MIRGSLLRQILSLSLPAIVTNITTPLLSMADLAIAGRVGGATIIAAVALGGTIFNLIYWLCGFLRMGSSGLTAQAKGQGDTNECRLIFFQAMMMAFGLGTIFIIFQKPIYDIMLWIMSPDEATTMLVQIYFGICVYGSPAVLGTYALTGWLLGMQNTRIAMIVSIATNIFNIVFSATLVFAFGQGVRGIATGTLCAQWISFLLLLIAAYRKFGLRPLSIRTIVVASKLKQFFKINGYIFLRTLCLVAVTMWFTRTGARQGDMMLAVNSLLLQLFTGFSFFMDGFAFAGEAMCGYFEGAHEKAKLRSTIKTLLIIGCVMSGVFSVIYFVVGDKLLFILSNDANIVANAVKYMCWAAIIPIVGFMAFVFDGVAIGTSRVRPMLQSMIVAAIMFFAINLSLTPSLGNHALWIAFGVYLFTRGVVLGIRLRSFYFPGYSER